MSNGFDRRTFLGGAGMAAITITMPGVARAQSYPARPVTVVIMYAAGGGTDVLIRKLAEEMANVRGWDVSIANRPGAVGGIATQYVGAQRPDGYNILGAANYNKFVRVLGHVPAQPAPWEQWAFMKAGNAIASWSVPVDSPFQTLQDVIDAARAEPGRISVSTSGTGGIWHEMALLIASFAQIELRYVAYQGGQPATLAGLQGEVDIAGGGVHEHIELVRAGQMRMLQHTGTEDIVLDDGTVLPTVANLIPQLAPFLPMGPTYNMIVRRDTPPEILGEIQSAFVDAANSDEFRTFLEARFFQPDVKIGEAADREAASMEVVTVDLFNQYADQIGSDVISAEALGLPDPDGFAAWWPPQGYKPLDL
ncbi:tripartite tricarboxylate transporter substrate binding protein [Roseicitreum antarcticum]|uniref:Tripartite-type tricarboxylate transporter, receptor component TctC n=1 Tax=Roseicitreum antarcticum TaxID=564137 RepID=A0A1H3AID5_9RHOB|nr:tripartite tricarboxylate transporter substrate binding protein [Roseicitreum antarcticum]SDX29201.1 Tripartite-type tricarboxylate transporter, receptor component TctC [Roseicitreum antarcticum]